MRQNDYRISDAIIVFGPTCALPHSPQLDSAASLLSFAFSTGTLCCVDQDLHEAYDMRAILLPFFWSIFLHIYGITHIRFSCLPYSKTSRPTSVSVSIRALR